MEESLVNVEFLKSSNNFIARIQSELGGMREYRSSSFEEVLEQVVIDLQEEFEESFRGHDTIYEADPLCGRRVDRVPRVDHLRGPSESDETRQALASAEARDDPDIDLRLAELRAVGRDPDVAREGEFASASEGVAVDRRQDGFVTRSHRVSESSARF